MRKRLLALITHRWVISAFLTTCFIGAMGQGVMSFGCSGWDPRKPFERHNPDVDRALEMIEDGQFENAEEILTDYLDTDVCEKGKIGLPENLPQKADGTFDLGLVLFYLAEKYGERFGDENKLLEKIDAGENLDGIRETFELRGNEIKCALIVALGIAKDNRLPAELRARAYYVAGNLEFLRLEYPKAIASYEEALKLVPGVVEEAGGDGIGRDAAWNRAVAIRRLEKLLEDAGTDGGEDADQQGPQPQDADGGQDKDGGDPNGPDGDLDGGGQDGGDPKGQDAGDDAGGGEADAGPDGGEKDQDGGDQGKDAGDEDPNDGEPKDPQDGEPQPAEPGDRGNASSDPGDRILERFDQMETYQQQDAKKRNHDRKRTLEDK
ncbi:MAG: hypothetical protein HOW73_48220 [Polyangiaceae bacterium]|nr:hypothetical protein [Polyangiaceae bacterium]